ncbi:MAG: hypothetical protein R3A51_18755 [Nannocystaceae bacterium]
MARRKVTRGSPPRLARSRKRTWPTASGSAPRARVRRAGAGDGEDEKGNFLGVYFREMSSLEVLSPEKELALATRIFRLRQEFWKDLLSYPPFIDAIIALIESTIDSDDTPDNALSAMRETSRNLRDRETRANKDAFEEVRIKLAAAVAGSTSTPSSPT